MRLSKKQKAALLEWVAEGLESDEINRRAAKFKPPFKVSRNTVKYYRQSRGVQLEEIKEADETSALKTGFAVREKRVEALNKLAEVLLNELTREEDNRVWMLRVKGIGSQDNYERVEEVEFNRSEFETVRGLLDDIAREVGERRPDMVVNNNFNFNMEDWKKKKSDRLKEVGELEED